MLNKFLVSTLVVLSLTLSVLTFKNEAENKKSKTAQVLIAYQIGCLDGTSTLYRRMTQDPLIYQFHCSNLFKAENPTSLLNYIEDLEREFFEK